MNRRLLEPLVLSGPAVDRDLAVKEGAARNELIAECMQDALNDGDGRPRPNALAHHLAKHGLVIVEASKYDGMRSALQVFASCTAENDASDTLIALVARQARKALAKGA